MLAKADFTVTGTLLVSAIGLLRIVVHTRDDSYLTR